MGFFSKKKKDDFDVRAAFAENLKYIHQDSYTPDNIRTLFQETNAQHVHLLGDVTFPTGQVVVTDPLCYLYNPDFSKPLNYSISPGNYPVLLSIFFSEYVGLQIVAAKLKISAQDAVRYEIAMPEGTTIAQLNEPGILAGFGVDAGVACFCDHQTATLYSDFIAKWHRDHPGQNHYDDYFAAFFETSYQQQPNLQRDCGDFILWAIPETDNRVAMFSSGMGDGFYQSLWGFDSNNQLCELVIPFINPALF